MTQQSLAPAQIHGVTHDVVAFKVPPGACDCHTHVFGPVDKYPLSPSRVYTPDAAAVEDLLALGRHLGMTRVVIVHPSPYGTDNRCTVDALKTIGANSRGVAVIDETFTDSQLKAMHDAGVRGIRLNFETSGVNEPTVIAKKLQWAHDKIASLGWHLQMFTNIAVLASIQNVIRKISTPVVVDHFCRAKAELGTGQPNFDVLLDLVQEGRVWVKLSAAHRISSAPDCADVQALVQALVAANPDRMLWGTDWPHPGGTTAAPRKILEIEPYMPINDGHALNRLAAWVADDATMHKILVDNPGRLYGFDTGAANP